jgi:DNA mismatch endonuclease (patch repair protein)
MVDVVDKETRSRMMSGIRGRNTKPELQVRKALHAKGFRFRLHVRKLPGTPDLVFPKYRTVVFVHGCFWHRHEHCKFAATPKTNSDFWEKKLSANRDRDIKKIAQLQSLGWRVLTIWECEMDEIHLTKLAQAISAMETND